MEPDPIRLRAALEERLRIEVIEVSVLATDLCAGLDGTRRLVPGPAPGLGSSDRIGSGSGRPVETASLDTLLGSWQPIGLGEMNERAALLDRAENKYLLTTNRLIDVLAALRPSFQVLTIEQRNVFSYDTVYFDTPGLRCYRDHSHGKRLRLKARSRRYVDSGQCWFEVKLKGARGRTIKRRLAYDPADHGTITAEADRFLRTNVATVYGRPLPVGIGPSLAMDYRRVTLVGSAAPERVTIDVDLRFAAERQTRVAPSGVVIVEVKSPSGRGAADLVIRQHGARPQACSKYCIGLNLLHPGLPSNVFQRTLRTHFEWSDPTRP